SDVSVSIVDMVTSRNFNLYTELLELIRRSDPVYSRNPPATYAVTCKARKQRPLSKIGISAYQLVVGKELPKLPIGLADDRSMTIELESTYEEVCRTLRV